MLSGQAIKEAIESHKDYLRIRDNPKENPLYDRQLASVEREPRIVIEPYNASQLNPNSYNLRLADKLLIYTGDKLDMAADNPTEEIQIPKEGLVLEPGNLYLGSTIEHTETYNLVPRLDGRSSIGRLGISIHITAAYGDIGFSGCWTLEISVIHPIRVYAGVQLCQISYEQVQGEIEKTYSGKYQGTSEAKASNLFKEFAT